MTSDCIGCFAYDGRHIRCNALEDTNFPYPCPFRKDKKVQEPVIKRTCSNCFAFRGEGSSDCAILTSIYEENCPFHKTRYEYDKEVEKYGFRKTVRE